MEVEVEMEMEMGMEIGNWHATREEDRKTNR